MPRKAKKGSPRYYFHIGTENAIIRHNQETRPVIRERIYNEHIRNAFEKLAENIIHTFKFYYFDVPSEDVKHEVVSFLYMNMHKYDHTKVNAKGQRSNAFTYISIVAKNYLILHNNNNYKRMKQHDGAEVTDRKRDPISEIRSRDARNMKIEYVDVFSSRSSRMYKYKGIDYGYLIRLQKILDLNMSIENIDTAISIGKLLISQ